jgi:hypothetical protein
MVEISESGSFVKRDLPVRTKRLLGTFAQLTNRFAHRKRIRRIVDRTERAHFATAATIITACFCLKWPPNLGPVDSHIRCQ